MFPAKSRCRVLYGEFIPHPIHLHSAISSNAQSWAGAEGFPSQKQVPTTKVILDRWSMTKLWSLGPTKAFCPNKSLTKENYSTSQCDGCDYFQFFFFSRWWEHFWMFKNFVQKFQKVLWWILLRWLSQILRGLLRNVWTWSSRLSLWCET